MVEGLASDLAAGERSWPSVQLRLASLQASATSLGAAGRGARSDGKWTERALGRLQAAACSLSTCKWPQSQRAAIARGAWVDKQDHVFLLEAVLEACARAGLLETAAALAHPPRFCPAAVGPLLAEVEAAWLAPGQPLQGLVRGAA